MNNQMMGGWSEYKPLTEEAKKVFEDVLNNFVGVDYSPLLVATQVVAGENMNFFCNAKAVYPSAPNKGAIVSIYKPLDGEAHITEIKEV